MWFALPLAPFEKLESFLRLYNKIKQVLFSSDKLQTKSLCGESLFGWCVDIEWESFDPSFNLLQQPNDHWNFLGYRRAFVKLLFSPNMMLQRNYSPSRIVKFCFIQVLSVLRFVLYADRFVIQKVSHEMTSSEIPRFVVDRNTKESYQ